MLLSMTGYGRATCQLEDRTIVVEMKSVNHRFLDLSLTLPREWAYLEDALKREISAKLKRGKVSAFISVEGASLTTTKIGVDWDIFNAYVIAFEQIHSRLGLDSKPTYDRLDWLQVPDLFQHSQIPIDSTELEQGFKEAIHLALGQLVKMRQTEGNHLIKDLQERLDRILVGTKSIQAEAPRVIQAYQERLQKRMKDLLQELGAEIDEGRVIHEVAIFAEKTDLSEEITRLTSHLLHFREMLEQEQGPIGRQLDFLIQEMNREVNTIGSKSPDVEITKEVVQLKGELEKIREQVQNIE